MHPNTIRPVRRHRTAALLVVASLAAGGAVISAAPSSTATSLTSSQVSMDLTGLAYSPSSGLTAATTRFQQDNCLSADGVAGVNTQTILAYKTKQVQGKAGTSADGLYGPATTSAVKSYQSARGITANGLAGASTMSAMGITRDITCAPIGGRITRAEAIQRGKLWTEKGLSYSQTAYASDAYGKTYRMDCSGFVSMAWRLSTSMVTWTLPQVSTRITKDQLKPGDVLNATSSHVVMFVRWADAAHTQYVGMDEASSGATEHVIPYPYWSGYGTFLPYRYNNIVD